MVPNRPGGLPSFAVEGVAEGTGSEVLGPATHSATQTRTMAAEMGIPRRSHPFNRALSIGALKMDGPPSREVRVVVSPCRVGNNGALDLWPNPARARLRTTGEARA